MFFHKGNFRCAKSLKAKRLDTHSRQQQSHVIKDKGSGVENGLDACTYVKSIF